MGGRIRLAVLMLLLVSLPGAGIALAATGLGPDLVPLTSAPPAITGPAPPTAVPVTVAPEREAASMRAPARNSPTAALHPRSRAGSRSPGSCSARP